jgi:uracil-DNA glycosylase
MNIFFAGKSREVHPSWECFFTNEKINELKGIEEDIGSSYTPEAQNILRFAATDLGRVKVVILGQDPYPQKGTATGRSFEVGGISSWHDLKRNASLVNILKLLHKNYLKSPEVSPIKKIREDIDAGIFPLLPPDKLFRHWEDEGVLMLNAALTCEIDKPGSHKDIWSDFVRDALKFTAENSRAARWFLWGKNACDFCSFVSEENKFESHHPRLYNRTPGSFLAENHFAKVPEVNWFG